MKVEDIQKTYANAVLVGRAPDGPELRLYADDLMHPEVLEDALVIDLEQVGYCLTKEGVHFIDEVYGKEFLQDFYERHGYSSEEARNVVAEMHDDDPERKQNIVSRIQREICEDVVGIVGDSPLGFYHNEPDRFFTAKDFFQYPIFKPFLKSYFSGEAILTRDGYTFFERYNFPNYLSVYYRLVLHKDLRRFYGKETENWVAAQKEHAQSSGV